MLSVSTHTLSVNDFSLRIQQFRWGENSYFNYFKSSDGIIRYGVFQYHLKQDACVYKASKDAYHIYTLQGEQECLQMLRLVSTEEAFSFISLLKQEYCLSPQEWATQRERLLFTLFQWPGGQVVFNKVSGYERYWILMSGIELPEILTEKGAVKHYPQL